MSPCLQNIKNKNTEEYKEALAIIEKGKKELNKLPRLDMNGFIPSKVDQERLNKYLLRQNEEIKNREAIRNGSKYYDEGIHTTN